MVAGIAFNFRFVFEVIKQKALTPTFSLHWIFLLSAIFLALLVFSRAPPTTRQAGFARFLFPQRVWLHRSAMLDYEFFLLTMPLWTIVVTPLLLTQREIVSGLQAMLPPPAAGRAHIVSAGLQLLYTLAVVIAADAKHYGVHRLLHSHRALWAFHKVHHSALVLTPVTAYRAHPVEMLLQAFFEVLVTGTVTLVFVLLFGAHIDAITIFGVNAARFIFDLLGANLQHSHIFLSFGSRLEHVFISPAQHQLHHSIDPRHRNTNFGLKFALWDWMFGTLRCSSSESSQLRLGLPLDDDARFATLSDLYLRPFAELWQRISLRWHMNPRSSQICEPPRRRDFLRPFKFLKGKSGPHRRVA